VTWGETRDEAADKQIAALDLFEIKGLGHNIDFLSAIMQHPRFRSGELTTGFIAEEYPDGFTGAPPSEDLVRKLAAIAGFIATARADRARRVSGQLADTLLPPSHWNVKIGDAAHEVALDDAAITVDGAAIDLAMEYAPGDRIVLAEVDGDQLGVQIATSSTGLTMTTRGAKHEVTVLPQRIAHLSQHMLEKVPPDLSKYLICPMPGLLVALHVEEGDKVEAGQPLAVVEAMKMENILRAEKSATIAKVNAKAGDSLAVDAIILELE
jgi:propionyl-CoA carboxylase alpha chain